MERRRRDPAHPPGWVMAGIYTAGALVVLFCLWGIWELWVFFINLAVECPR